jgi:uncharacterized protein (UPF0332 family)
MKNKINLKKLNKLKIIQIVEPSKNLEESYIRKSEESLLSTKFLFEKKQYNDSISLSYFSMYNSVLALFYRCGIKCENHNASIYLLKEIFEIENIEIKNAKVERKDKQYYPSFSTNKEEVYNAIKSAERFNGEIKDFIDKLDSKKIESFRTKLKNLLK